ncbi:MAG: peptide deformylase [Myxococcales bacterium]
MAFRKIVLVGNPVLRERAAEVEPAMFGTEALRELVRDMVETMRLAPGVGLAAPQIGVSLRVIVLEDQPDSMSYLNEEERKARERVAVPLRVIVNPVLRYLGPQKVTFGEGCLSVPGYAAQVARFREVEVTGFTEEGEPYGWGVSGWPARILQHEVDHLDGTVYVDRMNTRTFTILEPRD